MIMRWHFVTLAAAIVLASMDAPSLSAQAAAPLVEAARKATEVFTDRRVAIAAGYRRVGRDFPSMGEHWLSPRLIVEGTFDVARPSVLTYVTIGGKPVLAGVVYAIPLAPGQAPPDAFGTDARWHEHNGTIDEESLLAQHHSAPNTATGTRVAVLHAWTRLPNPGGIFAAENWAIPFLRLGFRVPEKFPESAARALSLLSGGKPFFMAMAGEVASELTARALDECARKAERLVLRARTDDHSLTGSEITSLETAWVAAMTLIANQNPEAAHQMMGSR